MPSVTEVLDYATEPELMRWYRREGFAKCDRIGNEAKVIGTIVDETVQRIVQGKTGDGIPVKLPGPEVMNCLQAFSKFLTNHQGFIPSIKSLQAELRHGDLVGHPDFLIEEPHRWGIVDLKTSKRIYSKHWTQVAQYAFMQERLLRLAIQTVEARDSLSQAKLKECPQLFVAILRLDKESGQYEYVEVTDLAFIQSEVKMFDAYRMAYDHGTRVREFFRQQHEEEVLGAS